MEGSFEDGAVVVEFAIVASLLFLLVFGIIQFGLAFSRYQAYTAAAREGARVAAVRGTPDEVLSRIDNASNYPLELADVIMVTSSGEGSCSADTRGEEVTVTWPQPFEISIPFGPVVDFTLDIKGVFRCE
jgi:Flp pilus assembly protein TadG